MKPIIKIVNSQTGEEIEREMNTEEYEIYLDRQERHLTEQTEIKAQAEAKTALLERLGITAEEAKLLLSQHNLEGLCLDTKER